MKGGNFRKLRRPSGFTGKKSGERAAIYGEVKTTDSLDRLRTVLNDAIQDKLAPKGKAKGQSGCCPVSVWAKDVTPERVVFELDGKVMACRYEKDGTGVKLGPAYEVETVYRPVKESEG